MGALTNGKHELFAQALAQGMSATAAYAEAGYSPHDGNAARLSGNERVRSRVAELKARAASGVVVNVATITERLLAIAAKGERSTEAPMLSVARASLMDAAKLNGLIIERAETGKPGDFDRMTDAELARYVATEAAALGLRSGGAEATDDQEGVRGQSSRVH